MYKNNEGYNDITAGKAVLEADKIDGKILVQLCSLKEEAKDLRRRIKKLDEEIDKMNVEGYYVTDSVTCGKKGKKPLGTKKVSGFPHPEYERKIRYKKIYKNQLERKEADITRDIYRAELYIENIEPSRTRRIVRYKCLDDSLSWQQIANKMGGKNTAESCRITFERVIGIRK